MNNEQEPNNAVLANTLVFIQRDIKVIKDDVKEIKSDFLSRREFTEHQLGMQRILDAHDDEIKENSLFISNIKGKYAILAVIGMATLSIIASVVGSALIERTKGVECPTNFICTNK